MTATTRDLDVVIVSYNTRPDLAACLTSLLAHPPARLGRVVVVDNGSSDDSVAWVRAHLPAVEVIALGRNAGFAAANNVAIRRSTAALVLLLNSDTIVPPGALDALVARLEATGAVAAGPRLVDGRGRPEISFGPMLGPWGEWVQRRRVRAAASDTAADRRRTEALLGRERDVDWVTGACLLVRRDAALAAGLLDERYFMYEEDVDFCAALRRDGGRVLFTPAAEIVHLRGRSMAHVDPRPRAQGAGRTSTHYDRSHVLFYEKHRPLWAPVLRAWLRLRGRAIR